MKKLLSALLIVFLIVAFGMAEDWHFETDELASPDTLVGPSMEVKPFVNYINFRLNITGTPTDSIAADTIRFYIQTKFSARGDETWRDLLALTEEATDTATIDYYLPIDSLNTGTYKLGQFIRTMIITSDTITGDMTYTEDPWEYRLNIGYH